MAAEKSKISDVIGKQAPLGEVEQNTADNMFAQILAGAINEIEQDDFQSRASFSHLGFMQYYKQWKKNSAYHKKLLEMYRNCDSKQPKKNAPEQAPTDK